MNEESFYRLGYAVSLQNALVNETSLSCRLLTLFEINFFRIFFINTIRVTHDFDL